GIFEAGTTGTDWDDQVLSKFSLFPERINLPLELSKLDSLRIKAGKDYPFIDPPTGLQETVDLFNRIVLDVKVYGGDYATYDYSIKAFYKNHGQNGDGFMLARKNKSTGTVGRFLFINREDHSTTPENKAEVSKIDLGGIQQINISNFEGTDWEITVDTDAMPTGILSAGATGTDWDNHKLDKFSLLPLKVDVKVELNKIDSLRVNKGKDYPFATGFSHNYITA